MKSLDDLKRLQAELKEQAEEEKIVILVGMATCGISAGAKPVMAALIEAAEQLGLEDVVVKQTGCIGVCRLEPMFDVFDPVHGRTTYVDMTPEKAKEVIESHIVKGEVLQDYTVVAYD